MKTLRAITIACVFLLNSITTFAGEGVLTPGADKTSPPPPPSASPTSMTNAATGETDENLLLLYAAAIWLQLSGITVLP